MKVEKAKIGDVPQIQALVNYFAAKDEMLPRSLSELYENIRDCFVIREDGRVVACASLHVFWSDLAEIRSLAVAEGSRDKGLAAQLLKACLAVITRDQHYSPDEMELMRAVGDVVDCPVPPYIQ